MDQDSLATQKARLDKKLEEVREKNRLRQAASRAARPGVVAERQKEGREKLKRVADAVGWVTALKSGSKKRATTDQLRKLNLNVDSMMTQMRLKYDELTEGLDEDKKQMIRNFILRPRGLGLVEEINERSQTVEEEVPVHFDLDDPLPPSAGGSELLTTLEEHEVRDYLEDY